MGDLEKVVLQRLVRDGGGQFLDEFTRRRKFFLGLSLAIRGVVQSPQAGVYAPQQRTLLCCLRVFYRGAQQGASLFRVSHSGQRFPF